MSRHKKILGFAAVCALILITTGGGEVLGIASAHAQLGADAGTWEQTLQGISKALGWLINILTILGLLCITLIEFFLSPQLYAGVMSDNGPLKDLWLLSRDIMNIIFAFMLLGMAFYTIVIGNSAKIKENIVWFVLAVVLVNLSWFFPRIILDFANVLTATIFTIPSEITTVQCQEDGVPTDCIIITRAKLNVPTDEALADGCQDFGSEAAGSSYCHCFMVREASVQPICWWTAPFDAENMTRSSALVNALAVNFARIEKLPLVARSLTAETDQPITQSFSFLFGIAFSLIFGLAVVLALVGLAVGLVIRVIILWATIAFMPFSFLGFIINKGKLGTDVFGIPVNIWKEFMNAAFLPAMVAIPLSVGFMMVMTGYNMTPPFDPAVVPFDFNMELFGQEATYWSMLWQITALIVLWTGTFAALSRSEIIGKFTGGINALGKSLGGALLKLPLLASFPVGVNADGSTKTATLGQLKNLAMTAGSQVEYMALHPEQGFKFDDLLSGRPSGPTESARNVAGTIKDPDIKTINDHLKTYNDTTLSAETRRKAWQEIQTLLEKQPGVNRNEIKDEEGVMRFVRGMQLEIEKNPAGRTNIDRNAASRAEAVSGRKLAGNVEVKSSQNNAVTINDVAGNERKINFNDAEFSLDSADGRRRFLDSLGIGEMANTQQGLDAAKKALENIKNSAGIDVDKKAKLDTILASINGDAIGNTTLDQHFQAGLTP